MLRVRTINDLKKKDKRQNRRKINKEMLNGKGIRQEGKEIITEKENCFVYS